MSGILACLSLPLCAPINAVSALYVEIQQAEHAPMVSLILRVSETPFDDTIRNIGHWESVSDLCRKRPRASRMCDGKAKRIASNERRRCERLHWTRFAIANAGMHVSCKGFCYHPSPLADQLRDKGEVVTRDPSYDLAGQTKR
jgi:hypothetical protein